MAITSTHYQILRSLAVRRGSSLLEIGEANWFADINPASVGLTNHESLFDVAKDFYREWFAPSKMVAIDINGTPSAIRHDLNTPLDLGERFDVVINSGTAEHVFDIARVFRTMHDHCELDGWMIHDAPFHGWVDHGFYCLQPTLFYDLSAANRYEVSSVAIHEYQTGTVIPINSRDHVARLVKDAKLPASSLLLVALRKRVDAPFVVPMQGYYAGTLTAVGRRAWEDR